MSTAVDTAALISSFHQLSVTAVIFCSLSSLFSVYLVLFAFAIWATYRRNNVAQRRLRIVTIVMFLTLVMHYASRAVEFGRTRLLTPPSDEQRLVDIPLLFLSTLATTVACAISDGLLAWRFYNVFERRRWALYVPSAAVVINLLFGLAEDCLFLSFYHSSEEYSRMELYSFKMNIAWAWATFAINSVMTVAIMSKILLVSRSSAQYAINQRRVKHSVVLEAICESALVTWIGVILLEIAELAPTKGHVNNHLNFGYVIDCILPIFFGISQCLITARLGFAGAITGSTKQTSNVHVSTFVCNASRSSGSSVRENQAKSATLSEDSDTISIDGGSDFGDNGAKKEIAHAV
ncbi:hypothetical protein BC629DRAFT_368670 [Irpex lacteus]|nr:hypothetical protein BC629DRAFT_368670 [Irpex lacteus]